MLFENPNNNLKQSDKIISQRAMTAQNQSRQNPIKQNIESQRPSKNQPVILINPNKI